MKAVISSTYDSKYLYFLPIVTWLWNRLGVDVICFMPAVGKQENLRNLDLINTVCSEQQLVLNLYPFYAPKHKEATYAQCLRTYAAALDFPEDEILCTSDVDMALFQIPPYVSGFTVFGSDLVPPKQYPICYISAKVKDWRNAFEINNRTYQQCIDDLLGDIEAEHYRGNFWAKDQENAYNKINLTQELNLIPRSNGQNQFAQNRVDRTDTNWRSYVNDELIDAHLWRDGFTDENHANIMELMRMKFPDEDFTWLQNYRDEYLKLL